MLLEKNQSFNLCLPIYFLGEKSKLEPMSSNLRNDKFLFGMLYINLLKLVWFWSRIWGFYKFWSFKSWGFEYLRLSWLILILYMLVYLRTRVNWNYNFLLTYQYPLFLPFQLQIMNYSKFKSFCRGCVMERILWSLE